MSDEPLIFLSYATPDRVSVTEFYDALRDKGFNTWIDHKHILPGQNWDVEIRRAISKAVIVVAFISNNSVNRRGYVQRELKIALDLMADKLVDDIFLIPVGLDDKTPIPDHLKHLHLVRASDANCHTKLVQAIEHQLQKLNIELTKAQSESEIEWHSTTFKDAWDGAPGFEIEFNWHSLTSEKYPRIGEISEIIKGTLLSAAIESRSCKIEEQSTFHSYGQESFFRTNTWEAICSNPLVVGRVISFCYSAYWYFAGAAHPNHGFLTYCFLLDPILPINKLDQIFEENDKALDNIRSYVRKELLSNKLEGEDQEEASYLRPDWVNEGTSDWDSFSSFTFNKDGLTIFFPPYQVGSYADGSHEVVVPFEAILQNMRYVYACAFDQEYKWRELNTDV